MEDPLRPWSIDAGVARDLASAWGWQVADGPAALAALVPCRLPIGSTAKLAAVAAGEVPPGADVDVLARTALDHAAARTAAAPGAPVASPAYSCWVAATVMAAVLDGAGLGPVRVAATRRIDDDAPIVDLHAAVVVGDGSGTTWMCDPYFGLAVPLPDEPGAVRSVDLPLSEASVALDRDGGWTFDVQLRRWDRPLRYRLLAPALDRGDVRAVAAISVSHTGVPSRPYARLHLDGAIVDASEQADGSAQVRRWSPAEGASEDRFEGWLEAVDAFAERTGTRII